MAHTVSTELYKALASAQQLYTNAQIMEMKDWKIERKILNTVPPYQLAQYLIEGYEIAQFNPEVHEKLQQALEKYSLGHVVHNIYASTAFGADPQLKEFWRQAEQALTTLSTYIRREYDLY